jgi:hypothetical protein
MVQSHHGVNRTMERRMGANIGFLPLYHRQLTEQVRETSLRFSLLALFKEGVLQNLPQ